MAREELYTGREQTLVKHFILQKYLERFAHIVGWNWGVLTYVDCFSGPWNVRSERFEDSSFGIALQQLRQARDTHAARGHPLRLRCFFLEKDPAAYAQLAGFAQQVGDVEIRTLNASLDQAVSEIARFCRSGGPQSVPFVFIDPTGWTGFEMQTITPLLQLDPGEVLINFMTSHIRRFIDSPQDQTIESFVGLFGSAAFRDKLRGLSAQDREDAAVSEYAANAKRVGRYRYACSAIVLHPEIDRTHFNLIYLTRHQKGMEVFKEVEKKAMALQEAERAQAQQRRRVDKAGQPELFAGREIPDSSHYEVLRTRYLTKTKSLVWQRLVSQGRLDYDDAWTLALSEPLSWESDLKDWIREWEKEGKITVAGLQPKQRVPHRLRHNATTACPGRRGHRWDSCPAY